MKFLHNVRRGLLWAVPKLVLAWLFVLAVAAFPFLIFTALLTVVLIMVLHEIGRGLNKEEEADEADEAE